MKTSSSAGCSAPGFLVETGELDDQEEVVVVDVQLRPLVDAGHVLQVQGMEAEVLGKPGQVGGTRILDVVPAQPARLDHLDPRVVRRRDLFARRANAAPRSQEPWQLPHHRAQRSRGGLLKDAFLRAIPTPWVTRPRSRGLALIDEGSLAG